MGCYSWVFLDHFFSVGRCLCFAYFPRNASSLDYRRTRGCVSREKGPQNMLFEALILGIAEHALEGPGLRIYNNPKY
jgi:hypothetical protein